jgi:hypothetical protein
VTGGCPTHARLVGGYVLGALDPEEMEEMRRHVAWCPHCGPEVRRLTELPVLLDRIEPADVPPPSLAPQVEDAVLDRFARERGSGSGRPARRARSGPRWPGRRVVAALAGAGLAAVVLVLALAGSLGGEDDGAAAYASANLGGLAPAPAAGATAELAEVPAGTKVHLRARGLQAARGAVYELWCIRGDGRWVSGGTFRADRGGRAEAELTAAVRPGDYHVMVVTRRADDARENARGTAVLRGRLAY